MTKGTKALILMFFSYALFFLSIYYALTHYHTAIQGFWIPLTAGICSTLLAPQFKSIKTPKGEKIFMRWLLLKEVKEIKW